MIRLLLSRRLMISKDDARKIELINKWLALDVNLKAQIKQSVICGKLGNLT